MDALNSPETWRWIWLFTAIAFALSEMLHRITFFFLPFAVAAAIAAFAAWLGAPVLVEWILFVGFSVAAFAALWPIGRRLDNKGEAHAIGSTRWIGQEALVLEDIPGGPGGTGLVRLEREHWRAESLSGEPIRRGSTVQVTRLDGTRLVVVLLEECQTPNTPQNGPASELTS